MEDYIVWGLIGAVGFGAIVALIVFIIKLIKMTPEQREEAIIDFLVGLVTAAEIAYDECGKGSEKLKDVEAAFKAKAPWFLKLLLAITNTSNLVELIEKALEKAKNTWGKKE